jgi:hypothetical protein
LISRHFVADYAALVERQVIAADLAGVLSLRFSADCSSLGVRIMTQTSQFFRMTPSPADDRPDVSLGGKPMEANELAFHSTQELVDELLRRQSFCGVIVQAADDNRQAEWPAERIFKVQFNRNFDSDRAARLLDVVAEYMHIHLE